MKRIFALGAGLVLSTAATAQLPAYPLPQPTLSRSAPASSGIWNDLFGRVSADAPAPGPASPAVAPPPPTYPTVPPPCVPSYGYGAGLASGGCPTPGGCGPACGTPLFTGGLRAGNHDCFDRFSNWLCYKPGPRALPVLTPTPYQAPLRSYFRCAPGCGAGCGATCPPQPAAPTPPLFGLKLVNADPDRPCRGPLLDTVRGPRLGNGGLTVRSPGCCPVPGQVCYGYSPPVAPPAPCGTPAGGCGGCTTGYGRVGSVFDNVLGFLIPGYLSPIGRPAGSETAGCGAGGCGPDGCGRGGVLAGCHGLFGVGHGPRTFGFGRSYESTVGCANGACGNGGVNGANCVPAGVPGPTLAGYRMANPFGYPTPLGLNPSDPSAANQPQPGSGPPPGPPVANPPSPAQPFTNP